MRLLNTKSLKLEYFAGNEVPEYAILSHRWEAEEILFQDVQTDKWPHKKGADKVKRACLQAKDDGFEQIWIDTCCIDKSSSAELSEAINSMFSWYHDSQVCYAYLFDVPTGKTEAFAKSEWFTRGWTLQELIAPRKVQFFDSQWRMIGDRLSLLDSVVKVTAIDRRVLDRGRHHRLCPSHVLHSSGFMISCYCDRGNEYPNFRELLSSFSVARRISWASTRVTTRVEDRAYALLGLFNVNMPLLYGEGTKAFQRLQEEIIRHSNDQSVLA
ncbi:heterokaryon incompatibility protein-domain-containing protein, partial [Ilyonectria sp. MPI-CAGE-AT-0026]